MTVEEKKCSGNAQYLKQGRIMHHGTILYDSDLGVLFQALNGSKDKIESKGIKSVRSPVTNIRPYMKTDMPISGFWAALKECMFTAFNLREYTLSPEENAEVEKLREQTYSQWNWNYGASPPYQVRKTRCIEGCGKFDMLLDVEKEGIIKGITFYDDFLGNADPDALTAKLTGHHLEYGELKETLGSVDVSRYFHHLNTEHLLSLLLE